MFFVEICSMQLVADPKISRQASAAIAWIRRQAAKWDLSRLDRLRLLWSRSEQNTGVWGFCWSPEGKRGFRISCMFLCRPPFNEATVDGPLRLETMDEALVWIFGHEFNHFLHKSHQLPGRDTERLADEWATELLGKWRQAKARRAKDEDTKVSRRKRLVSGRCQKSLAKVSPRRR